MRLFYTLFWICALPLVLARLLWRGRKEPGYLQHIAERFGLFATVQSGSSFIWIHAVSVGETRAAEPLIRALLHACPNHRILLSHMTATGRATGAMLFNDEIVSKSVVQCFLPYDIPLFMSGLINHFSPVIAILMETEVWPNLIHTCSNRQIPVALVNARLSPRSLQKARKVDALIRPASAALRLVAAQTNADADRIRQTGATNVVVTGNSKFDVTVPVEKILAGQKMRKQWDPAGNRPVLLCASTREGEEELILNAFSRATIDHLLLIIVPRHPQRFDEVNQLIHQRSFITERRTTLGSNNLEPNVQVLLGDTMGELGSYYVGCDIAYVGGSLLPLGGQNLIEACAAGKPVLIGPHTYNFEAISIDAVAARAARRIRDADELFYETAILIQHVALREQMGECACVFAQQHRGATEKTVALLMPLINATRH